MTITVKFFGQLAEIIHKDEFRLELEEKYTLKEFLDYWQKNNPNFDQVPYKVAINSSFLPSNTLLENGMTLAFLPPFAGG